MRVNLRDKERQVVGIRPVYQFIYLNVSLLTYTKLWI